MSDNTELCKKYHLDESSLTPEQIKRIVDAIELKRIQKAEAKRRKKQICVIIDNRKRK